MTVVSSHDNDELTLYCPQGSTLSVPKAIGGQHRDERRVQSPRSLGPPLVVPPIPPRSYLRIALICVAVLVLAFWAQNNSPVFREAPIPTSCSTSNRLGTRVDFVSTPMEADRQARGSAKLTFFLHVAGDFDDSAFT